MKQPKKENLFGNNFIAQIYLSYNKLKSPDTYDQELLLSLSHFGRNKIIYLLSNCQESTLG